MTSDLAPSLLVHGYRALPRARARHRQDGDAFTARLLGQRTLVVRGEEGARLLYDESRIRRRGAVPRPLAALLFGRGAVHGLDGEEHRARKRIFLDLLTDDAVTALGELTAEGLREAVLDWSARDGVRLHDELVRVYGLAVLEWGGTGCRGKEAEAVGRDLADVVAGFGMQGPAYLRAWRARLRVDAWARDLVSRTRAGAHRPPPGSAVHAFALGAGAHLPVPVAAVDLLNVLRPTVAVSWLGTFAALALAEHPELGGPLLGPEPDRHLRAFAQEVRRTTPFVPALTGLSTSGFRWHGLRVRRGDRVLLDVPGTDLHPREWLRATEFRPERFLDETPGPYHLVPQGGGDVEQGHRCPGEGLTMAVLVETLRCLSGTAFTVHGPEVRTDRVPAMPAGGLVVSGVRPRADVAEVADLADVAQTPRHALATQR
jgi:fatty-acid peroxygenase